jgi:hypothetical protein
VAAPTTRWQAGPDAATSGAHQQLHKLDPGPPARPPAAAQIIEVGNAKEAGEQAAADLQAALSSAGMREQLLNAQLAARDEQLARQQAEQQEQVRGRPGGARLRRCSRPLALLPGPAQSRPGRRSDGTHAPRASQVAGLEAQVAGLEARAFDLAAAEAQLQEALRAKAAQLSKERSGAVKVGRSGVGLGGGVREGGGGLQALALGRPAPQQLRHRRWQRGKPTARLPDAAAARNPPASLHSAATAAARRPPPRRRPACRSCRPRWTPSRRSAASWRSSWAPRWPAWPPPRSRPRATSCRR